MSDRTDLADQAVKLMQDMLEDLPKTSTTILRIHWDDCDMDDRKFWFYFSDPSLPEARPEKHSRAKKVSKLIQFLMARCKKELEARSSYRLKWNLLEAPKPRLSGNGRYRYFNGWATDTWVYTLALWGGPDAVTVQQLCQKR